METRARYILVGAFTLAAFLAALGFLLWLARVQIDRTYAQYDILFDTVSGLSQTSVVRYNGVDVGSVLAIALDLQDPSRVRVRIEVIATTPVRSDTVARLTSQGVTGVSYVALEGGSADAPSLRAEVEDVVPVITSEPSIVEELTDAAPDLLREATALIADVRAFTTPQNSAAVTRILANAERATARVDAIADEAEALLTSASDTLARADAALTSAESAFASADAVIDTDLPPLIERLTAAATDIRGAATQLEGFARTGLPEYTILAADARRLVARLGAIAERIGSDPGRFLLGTQTPAYRN
jgi:phospholipid/cholesterol/gamma-HCH transport system substrate-binding protein